MIFKIHVGWCALFLLTISCGESDPPVQENLNMGGSLMGDQSDRGESCQIDDDCVENEYCQATDPTLSPSGQCSPLEEEGDACRRGTACSDQLVCIKDRSTGEGTCRAFPDSCANDPTCDCALQSFCVSPAGSSCSVEVLDAPSSSMTATCAELL
jgi:hypothetical protein